MCVCVCVCVCGVANMGWRRKGGLQLWDRGMLRVFNYGMDGYVVYIHGMGRVKFLKKTRHS